MAVPPKRKKKAPSKPSPKRTSKKTKAASREIQYQQAIAAANCVVYQLDFKTQSYTFMSDGIQRLLGCPAEEVTPAIWLEISKLDRMRGAMVGLSLSEAVQQFRNGTLPVWTADYKVQARDEKTRYVSDSSILVRDAKGNVQGCLGILQDITARRMLEERLRQSDKMEAIGRLAGGIAHDFNNILAAIMGSADMIGLSPKHERVEAWAGTISRAASRAADLTSKLLAFARKGKYLSLPVNLHSVIADVVGLLEHSLDKQITIRQALSAHPPVTRGDATQLQSMLLNLAINARDAMPDGGVLEFTTCSVEFDQKDVSLRLPELQPGRYVCLTISDTGVGMSEEAKAHLFEPFFTTKNEGKGTGLGLASVYGTVSNHNGAVRVESAVGKGTSFLLYLPALDVEVEEERDERPDTIIEGKGSVLVVDDEEVVRSIVCAMLETLGYTVYACESGIQAIEQYQRQLGQIDLVLLDMVMPQMDGRETFAALKRIHPEVRVILSSGYTQDGQAHAMMENGILDFIKKPYRLSELSRKVASCLRQNR